MSQLSPLEFNQLRKLALEDWALFLLVLEDLNTIAS